MMHIYSMMPYLAQEAKWSTQLQMWLMILLVMDMVSFNIIYTMFWVHVHTCHPIYINIHMTIITNVLLKQEMPKFTLYTPLRDSLQASEYQNFMHPCILHAVWKVCFPNFLHYTRLIFLISRVMYCFKADIIICVGSYKYYVHNYITFAPFNANLDSSL